MLVATASLGFIAPMAAQASDVLNLEGMNDYNRSKKSSSKRYFDSKSFVNQPNDDLATNRTSEQELESIQNKFEAGSFSDTTTLDSKVVFTVGAVNSPHNASGVARLSESAMATYMMQSNLNTSFTGDDNLYVRLKTGNSTGWQTDYDLGTYLSSSKGNGDSIKVDKIWYTFTLGEKHTFWIGPKIENYYMHATTPSIYKPVTKQFTLGGNGAAYGASTNPGIGWAYKFDNGFAISSNAVSKDGDTSLGWATSESDTSWATQIGYTKPSYSASLIFNRKTRGWTDSYYTTPLGKARPHDGNSNNYGLRGWWRPEDSGTAVPSISLGYDFSTIESQAQDTSAYFVGLTWQDAFTPDDRIGLAFGQPQTRDDETTDPLSWEVYYSYKMNDSVTVTPAIFGSSDRNGRNTDADKEEDLLGAVIETTFKF